MKNKLFPLALALSALAIAGIVVIYTTRSKSDAAKFSSNSQHSPNTVFKTASFVKSDVPELKLTGANSEVIAYKYLGSWEAHDGASRGKSWKDTVALGLEKSRLLIRTPAQLARIAGALPALLTPDTESTYYKNIKWSSSQVSVMLFRVASTRQQTAILEIDTDNKIEISVNFKPVKELDPVANVELGTNLLVPLPVTEGENIIVLKILSNNGPPQVRMAMTFDQSKDFRAAWNLSWGFLNKKIYSKNGSQDTPMLKWDSLLGRLALAVEVHDLMTDNLVLAKSSLKSGSVIRDGARYLDEGFYRITYKSKTEEASEYFLIGSPRSVFSSMKAVLSKYAWDADTQFNIGAQIRRGEILLEQSNYDSGNRQWQDKVVYTFASLANFIKLRVNNATEFYKDIPGLHIRGFISETDNSTQFYRLYIPSSYTRTQPVPLLLIMPTAMAARERPFIESPFMASHHNAMQIARFAEKYGFGILWPGYRNAPAGWTYEAVHAEEVLRKVEKDYNIDSSKISIYGTCSGGFFGGRLLASYPKRFANIVYDRAVFDQTPSKKSPDSLVQWFAAINPSEKIIDNPFSRILVLNDGSKPKGHGEIELSEKFLEQALRKRNDIKHLLGKRPIGVELWDLIFDWLSQWKNDDHEQTAAPSDAGHGYVGPISEIFSRPFIVVEGTSAGPAGSVHIRAVIREFLEMYKQQFYGANFIVKKDTEITETDLRSRSLVLVGNPNSNSIWMKMQTQLPLTISSQELNISGQSFSPDSAIMAILKAPANKQNHVLLVGAGDLRNLVHATNINPSRAWFDCCVLEVDKKRLDLKIISKLADDSGQ